MNRPVRGPATFRESDVKRLIRATEAAGKKVVGVTLEGGRVTVETAEEVVVEGVRLPTVVL